MTAEFISHIRSLFRDWNEWSAAESTANLDKALRDKDYSMAARELEAIAPWINAFARGDAEGK